MDEAYYESMTENLDGLYGALLESGAAVSDDEIKRQVSSINLDDMPQISQELDMMLFRARYDDGFDKTDPNQYSYIHNPAAIRRLRYNQDGEAVLYTATNPHIAFEEIRKDKEPQCFYLSIWGKKNAKKENCCLVFNPQNTKDDKSNAGRMSVILSQQIGESTQMNYYLGKIGQLMEIENQDYRFSSLLASEMFKRYDALITTSAKSDGKELNITFSQKATDDSLEMKAVFRCETKSLGSPLLFSTSELGIIEGDKVIWYDLELDDSSFVLSGDLNTAEAIKDYYMKNPMHFSPLSFRGVHNNKCMIKIENMGIDTYSVSFHYLLSRK